MSALIERALRSVTAALAIVAGAAVLLLAFAICFDIVSRKFFGFSFEGSDEYGGYVLAMIGSVGLPYALLQRGHTRVDILMPYLPRPVLTAVNVLALASLLGYAALIAYFSYQAFAETLEFDSRANSALQTPLWIPQAIWVVGTWSFLVVVAWALLDALSRLRNPDEVNRRYGPLTAVQEVVELSKELSSDRGERR
ncbi:MAG: TRAP transporter small permease [Alphaproteobacteria bacterium]|nr:TRAP transporter small permease [Alphaproteobacteria bacterium]